MEKHQKPSAGAGKSRPLLPALRLGELFVHVIVIWTHQQVETCLRFANSKGFRDTVNLHETLRTHWWIRGVCRESCEIEAGQMQPVLKAFETDRRMLLRTPGSNLLAAPPSLSLSVRSLAVFGLQCVVSKCLDQGNRSIAQKLPWPWA